MAISKDDIKPGIVIEAWFNNTKSIIIVNELISTGSIPVYQSTAILANGKIINFTMGVGSFAFKSKETRILSEEEGKNYKLLYGPKV
jgi:hypothetical protein